MTARPRTWALTPASRSSAVEKNHRFHAEPFGQAFRPQGHVALALFEAGHVGPVHADVVGEALPGRAELVSMGA